MHTMLEQMSVQVPGGTPKGTERRLHYVDTLRGVASVQVLLSHGMLAFFTNFALASPSSHTVAGYLGVSPLFFLIDGASAVCIFFVLSGYVLTPVFTHSRATDAAMIGSRFLRLGIPAVAGCAFSVIMFQAFGGYHETAGAIAQSQWLADGWRPSSDLWFLKDALVNGVILGFQDVSVAQWFGFPGSLLPSMENSFVTPLWTLSIEFYGSMFVLLLARSKSWTLIIIALIIFSRSYFLCFIAGYLAARFDLGGKRLLMPWPIAAAVTVIGLAVCMAGHFWSPESAIKFCTWSEQVLPPCPLMKPSYLMRVYGATVFTLGIMQCGPIRTFLAHRRLRALGRLSFPIYLTHWPIIFGIGSFLLVTLAPWAGVFSARLIALTVSIGMTILAAICFEPVDQIALHVSRAWRKQSVASE
jgi:peptidoglycan/LPS O-acetylase OafA/YrhL